VFIRFQRIGQTPGGRGQRQIGHALSRRLGLGAGGQQQMGLAGRGRAGEIHRRRRGALAPRQRLQLRQRAGGRGHEALEARVLRKTQRQRQLRRGGRHD
jgi:hypothetical protein